METKIRELEDRVAELEAALENDRALVKEHLLKIWNCFSMVNEFMKITENYIRSNNVKKTGSIEK